MSTALPSLFSRIALPVVLGLICNACGAADSNDREAPARPNLLLISIDTLRADVLGSSFPGRAMPTPWFNGFADQCTSFSQAWSHTPKTAPSHMTMLTGLPPRVHGVGNQKSSGNTTLGPEARTLAEVLQAAGYRTGAVTSGGNVKGYLGFERGFEIYDQAPKSLPLKLKSAREWLASVAGGPVAEQDSEQPWFMFFHTYAVHDPYMPKPEFARRYTDKKYAGEIEANGVRLRNLIFKEGDDRAKWASEHGKIEANYWERVDEDDPVDLQHLQNLYIAGVAEMDEELGKFIQGLTDGRMLDNTIVIITSDHGEEFGEHGMTRHNQLWDESLHVPLLIRLPGAEAGGTTIDAPVRLMDLTPSVLELLDVADPGTTLGESFAPWLRDSNTIDPNRVVLGEHRSSKDNPLDIWSLRAEGSLLILPKNTEQPLFFEQSGDSIQGASGATEIVAGSPQEAKRDHLLDLWKRELGRFQALGARFGAGEGSELDEETRAELEALGYL
jgi:arylsulfatase A-like enzyme